MLKLGSVDQGIAQQIHAEIVWTHFWSFSVGSAAVQPLAYLKDLGMWCKVKNKAVK